MKTTDQDHRNIDDVLNEISRRVARLCPDHRDPERFHEDKSEIVHELRSLARGMQ